MVRAFEFFGCVPKEVWWDNPRTVATLILQGRERRLHPRYAELASHYVFDPLFCMPARGNEKPDAEGTVKAVQRRFATPVPRVRDLDELNMDFRKCCDAEHERTVQSTFGPFQIGTRFAEEKVAATPLPKYRFDLAVGLRRARLAMIHRQPDHQPCDRRTTRVIRIQYLGEKYAEGQKRRVDSLLERDARRGQRSVDHLGVEDVVKRENIRCVERFDLFGNPPSCSLGHGRPPCR
ncbi:MAG: hypothetical protein ACLP53_21915, partial [Isosphaeraceae bacterium]